MIHQLQVLVVSGVLTWGALLLGARIDCILVSSRFAPGANRQGPRLIQVFQSIRARGVKGTIQEAINENTRLAENPLLRKLVTERMTSHEVLSYLKELPIHERALAAHALVRGAIIDAGARQESLVQYSREQLAQLSQIPELGSDHGVDHAIRVAKLTQEFLNRSQQQATPFMESLGRALSLRHDMYEATLGLSHWAREPAAEGKRAFDPAFRSAVLEDIAAQPNHPITRKILEVEPGATKEEIIRMLQELYSLSVVHSKEFTQEIMRDPNRLVQKLRQVLDQSPPDYDWLKDSAFGKEVLQTLSAFRLANATRLYGPQASTAGATQAYVPINPPKRREPYAVLALSGGLYVRTYNPEVIGRANILSLKSKDIVSGPEYHVEFNTEFGKYPMATLEMLANDISRLDDAYGRRGTKVVLRVRDPYAEVWADFRKQWEKGGNGPLVIIGRWPEQTPRSRDEARRYTDPASKRPDVKSAQDWKQQLDSALAKPPADVSPYDLMRHAREVVIKPGETLVVEGDASNYVYLLPDGAAIELSAEGRQTLHRRNLNLIGNTGVIRGGKRNATVTYVGDKPIKVLAIRGDFYRDHAQPAIEPGELADILRRRPLSPGESMDVGRNLKEALLKEDPQTTVLTLTGDIVERFKAAERQELSTLSGIIYERLKESGLDARHDYVEYLQSTVIDLLWPRLNQDAPMARQRVQLNPQLRATDLDEAIVKKELGQYPPEDQREAEILLWRALERVSKYPSTESSPTSLINELKKRLDGCCATQSGSGHSIEKLRNVVRRLETEVVNNSGVHSLPADTIVEGSTWRGATTPPFHVDARSHKLLTEMGSSIRKKNPVASEKEIIDSCIAPLQNKFFTLDIPYNSKDLNSGKNGALYEAFLKETAEAGGMIEMSVLLGLDTLDTPNGLPKNSGQGLETCRGHNMALTTMLQGAGLNAKFAYAKVTTTPKQGEPVYEDHAMVFVTQPDGRILVADGYFAQFNGRYLDELHNGVTDVPVGRHRVVAKGSASGMVPLGTAKVHTLLHYPNSYEPRAP